MTATSDLKVAIVILACRDYEALELSLACQTAYVSGDTPIFILQNCRGDYDAERTLQVALRYKNLFPRNVRVIQEIGPNSPYRSIRELLNSSEFEEFDLICKVDDDAFPITAGWLDRLVSCWVTSAERHGEKLAYVTPLINNNCWGFVKTLELLGLEEEYFSNLAREHIAGFDTAFSKRELLPSSKIGTGQDGTIWGLPYLARWLHEKTTLDPERFIEATKNAPHVLIPPHDRYSIGCILFNKELWNQIDDEGYDDEHMLHIHCRRNDAAIVCDSSIPFIHIAYFTQREENRDIVESAKALFQNRLKLPFPIGLRQSRLLEIESRLRWLETKTNISQAPVGNRIAPTETLNSDIHKMSAEMFGVHAFKGIIKAILFKLGLRADPPR